MAFAKFWTDIHWKIETLQSSEEREAKLQFNLLMKTSQTDCFVDFTSYMYLELSYGQYLQWRTMAQRAPVGAKNLKRAFWLLDKYTFHSGGNGGGFEADNKGNFVNAQQQQRQQ